jgi:hypothetical protein
MSAAANYQLEELDKSITGSCAHYSSVWADTSRDILSISGVMVTISSPQNYEFKNGKAPTTASGKRRFQE